MAMAAMARPSSIVMLTVKRQRPRWVFTPLALSSSSTTPSRKLILYSKPGCCLCDGLKEKLQAAFLISGPDSLHDVDLQVHPFLSLFVSMCVLLWMCWWVLSDKGHHQQSWVGKGLPVWDTCVGQSTSWWHWGQFYCFGTMVFLFICLCSHLSLLKLCMSGFSLSLSNFVYY